VRSCFEHSTESSRPRSSFVPADAWFGGAIDDPPIYEHTTPYGGPGATMVLTMLWASQHELQADSLAEAHGAERRAPGSIAPIRPTASDRLACGPGAWGMTPLAIVGTV
jgi:hypothetical protein